MANYKKWTQNDRIFIQNNCTKLSDKEIAKQLSEINGFPISRAMVRQQRRQLSILKKNGRPKKQLIQNDGVESG